MVVQNKLSQPCHGLIDSGSLVQSCHTGSVIIMSTPVMGFIQIARTFLATVWILWLGMLFISRMYILHEAYNAEVSKRQNETWLVKQCADAEFFSNFRQHSDLCMQVYSNSRQNLFLNALNTMAVNTYACGSMPCVDIIQSLVSRLGWVSLAIIGLVAFLLPNALFALHRFMQFRDALTHERALYTRHSRFGVLPMDGQLALTNNSHYNVPAIEYNGYREAMTDIQQLDDRNNGAYGAMACSDLRHRSGYNNDMSITDPDQPYNVIRLL